MPESLSIKLARANTNLHDVKTRVYSWFSKFPFRDIKDKSPSETEGLLSSRRLGGSFCWLNKGMERRDPLPDNIRD